MEWKDLSNEAKSIIEWVEDPRSNKRRTVEVELNKEFVFPMSFDGMPKSIMVTKDLYKEVLKFATEDKNLFCEQFLDGLIFSAHGKC
uniref:hypothetical protein n=1 Tax=Clostridium sp. 12(A) TaxID=1163671 RepID=UPI000467A04A|nr:hypothetical protein [Clostridium sp. 12(A)]